MKCCWQCCRRPYCLVCIVGLSGLSGLGKFFSLASSMRERKTRSRNSSQTMRPWRWLSYVVPAASYCPHAFISCVKVVHLWVAAAARGTLPLLFKCRWEPLVAGAACPLLVLGIGELLKRNDARVYDRYITLLRLEFDTRLGMHSPR